MRRVAVLSRVKGLAQELQTSSANGAEQLEFVDLMLQRAGEGVEKNDGNNELQLFDFGVIDPDLLNKEALDGRLAGCRWLQSTWVGVNVAIAQYRAGKLGDKQGLPPITKLGGVGGPHMAEWVLQQILNHERRNNRTAAAQTEARWLSKPQVFPEQNAASGEARYRLLSELSVALFGFGGIGRHVAGVLRSFGVSVRVLRRTSVPAVTSAGEELATFTDVVDLLAAGPADYLVCLLPSTQETCNILDIEKLQALKSPPVLLNAGRGDLITEDCLLSALSEGLLSGASVDVFAEEPLSEKSPLWKHPAVVVTPHIAMITFRSDVVEVFYKNLARLDAGADLLDLVDWDAGY